MTIQMVIIDRLNQLLRIPKIGKLYLIYLLASETPYSRRYDISTATRHPNYSEETDTNDIAVIRLRRAISFNTAIGPVCLPFR